MFYFSFDKLNMNHMGYFISSFSSSHSVTVADYSYEPYISSHTIFLQVYFQVAGDEK